MVRNVFGCTALLALLVSGCAGRSASSTADVASPTPYRGPLAAYAVVKPDPGPLSGLQLQAIDPSTGKPLSERESIELGHHGQWALSPDGSTMALGWAPTGNSGAGPERLFLIDLASWTPRDLGFEALIARIFWSQEGDHLYLQTRQRCLQPECVDSFGELVTIDPDSGNVLRRVELPLSGRSTLSPDGQALYLFGSEWGDPRVDPPQPLRLIAFDIPRGEVRGEVELPAVRSGNRLEDNDGDEQFVAYQAGGVMSPDGSRYYVAHPDDDKITVVDLETMTVERTATVHAPSSIIDRLFGLFTGTAHAKGGTSMGKRITISPDGALLYVTGWSQGPSDGGEEWEYQSEGLKAVDTQSFEIVEELPPPERGQSGLWQSYRAFTEPSGRSLYVLGASVLRIVEPRTLDLIAETPAPFYDFIVSPEPPGASSSE